MVLHGIDDLVRRVWRVRHHLRLLGATREQAFPDDPVTRAHLTRVSPDPSAGGPPTHDQPGGMDGLTTATTRRPGEDGGRLPQDRAGTPP